MQTNSPTPWALLRVWLLIGVQSFGGGAATLALVRRGVVDDNRWLTNDEFAQEFSLCQLTPGINLLAIAILIGRRLCGTLGILITLGGLLIPSVLITILISAFFGEIHRLPAGQAVIKGILPATVGLGLLNGRQMVGAPLSAGRKKGKASMALAVALLVGSGLAIAFLHLPVLLVLCSSAAIAAFVNWRQSHLRNRAQ